MRLEVQAVMLVCLCLASTARANERIELATAQITDAAPRANPGVPGRFESGVQFAIPLPTANTSDSELGIQGSVTITGMLNSVAGLGVDLGYSYWPTSSGFREEFNSVLKRESYSLLELGGTSWRFSALQTAAHVKIVAPFHDRVVPWLQIGAGPSWVNPRVRGLILNDGRLVPTESSKSLLMAGASGVVGLDLRSGSMRVGLDLTYDHLWSRHDFGADFDAFALGWHVLFGK